MITLLLGLIFLAALLSFVSYAFCWNDIQGGNPHIVSLRQITNIMDRRLLDMAFGGHDSRYHYKFPPEKLLAFRRAWGAYYYREIAADIVCMFGSYRYLTGDAAMDYVGLFILLAGSCQAINFVYSIMQVKKWGRQIAEELEDID